MNDSNALLFNINKLHTTKMGIDRIRKNLNLSEVDVVKYCKDKILKKVFFRAKGDYCVYRIKLVNF